MEAIGSEVGLKMRSAIKAKLMELGCYVDDELPDYVMVMVANKRTRSQMEEDLQLFLSANTEAFVNWLHQVLQKLQEVTINTKLVSVNASDQKKSKSKHGDLLPVSKKEHKEKDKKKNKEKSKIKEKVKLKSKKSKKDKCKKISDETKESDSITLDVPSVLLANLESESPPSITDVFAGQILKSHGISLIQSNSSDKSEEKTRRKLLRNTFPIIDPETVSQISSNLLTHTIDKDQADSFDIPSITEIEKSKSNSDGPENISQPKIHNEKKKSTESPGSGSEDEDFINIRTEAEELMDIGLNEEISTNDVPKNESRTPPLLPLSPVKNPTDYATKSVINVTKSTNSATKLSNAKEPIKAPQQSPPDLPQIELNLPKRPLRDRLGVKNENFSNKRAVNLVNPYQRSKSGKSDTFDLDSNRILNRLSGKMHFEKLNAKSNSATNHRDKISIKQRLTMKDNTSKSKDIKKKRIGSRVVPMQNEPMKNNITVAVASVVRAPPRPQPHGISAAPQLLLRAMADAHKSLLNMPPKVDSGLTTKKKALVFPIRRNVNPQKIIIEVPSGEIPTSKCQENQDSNSEFEIDMDAESLEDLVSDNEIRLPFDHSSEYVPEALGSKTDKPKNLDYIPTHITSTNRKKGIGLDNAPNLTKINPSNDSLPEESEKDPQFVVTLDGLDPNVFLEKKLKMIDHNAAVENRCNLVPSKKSSENKITANDSNDHEKKSSKQNIIITFNESTDSKNVKSSSKKCSNSEKISNKLENHEKPAIIINSTEAPSNSDENLQKKRKASPIIFNTNDTKVGRVKKSDGSKEDRSIISNKYDLLPSLPPDRQRNVTASLVTRESRCRFFPDCRLGDACEFYHPPLPTTPAAKQNTACRAFPACTYGSKCVYLHPPCKFNETCVRRDCPYSHGEQNKISIPVQNILMSPVVASRVVPATNYKTISTTSLPSICKFYPNCIYPACHWYHPKLCRFGKYCVNKVECNFYHHDVPSLKWKSSQ